MNRAAGLLLLLSALAPLAPAEEARMMPVPTLDLQRYSGAWYEIARLPNPFQKKCAHSVVVHYSVRDDGRLDVVNECVEADGQTSRAAGVARLADPKGPPSQLKVRFAPAFLSFLSAVWGDYWVIDLAPDYSYAVVGEPSREYLWILARDPRMDDATYARIAAGLAAQGYDAGKLLRNPAPAR